VILWALDMTNLNSADAALVSVTLRVNGQTRVLRIDPRYTLADVLRDDLGLTGLHLGCEQGVCGACIVTIDGEPALSCMNLAVQVDGAEIQTIEAICRDAAGLGRVEKAFMEHGAFQCGFCTPGFLVIAHHIVDNGWATSRERVRNLLSGNVCRCTGYEPIIDAIMAAGEERR